MKVGDYVKNVHTGQILTILEINLDLRNSTVVYVLSDGARRNKESFLENWTPVSLIIWSTEQKLVEGDYVRYRHSDEVCRIIAVYKTFTDHPWIPFVKVSKTIYLLSDGLVPLPWSEEQLHKDWQKVELIQTVPVEETPVNFSGVDWVRGFRPDFLKTGPVKFDWWISIKRHSNGQMIFNKWHVKFSYVKEARREAKKLRKEVCDDPAHWGLPVSRFRVPSDFDWAIFASNKTMLPILSSKGW
jgi:hypothetical protein